ncbi:MAG: prepilin peptidase [Erysipelotrichales bacterium]|nr:prepilin peptidase [Erysipelotrichales bacterium]
MWLIYICLFIIGLVLGSFYNVVGLRLPKNESLISPRSHCVNCNHTLNWYELIPVFSYIFLKGKCHKCKMNISIMYPLVEFTNGILFVVSFKLFDFSYETLISLILISVVMITIISDCKYMVILDEVLIMGMVFLFITIFFGFGATYTLRHILSGSILFLVMLCVKLIGDKSFKQESLGWGDVKLSFLAGFILGFKIGLVYVFLGAILALPYALYTTIKKNNGMIPFGPFLALSMLIIFWNSNLIINYINILLGV